MTSQISVEVVHDPSSRSVHTVSGVGIFAGSVLEVTNCFPFPIREEDEEIDASYDPVILSYNSSMPIINNPLPPPTLSRIYIPVTTPLNPFLSPFPPNLSFHLFFNPRTTIQNTSRTSKIQLFLGFPCTYPKIAPPQSPFVLA